LPGGGSPTARNPNRRLCGIRVSCAVSAALAALALTGAVAGEAAADEIELATGDADAVSQSVIDPVGTVTPTAEEPVTAVEAPQAPEATATEPAAPVTEAPAAQPPPPPPAPSDTTALADPDRTASGAAEPDGAAAETSAAADEPAAADGAGTESAGATAADGSTDRAAVDAGAESSVVEPMSSASSDVAYGPVSTPVAAAPAVAGDRPIAGPKQAPARPAQPAAARPPLRALLAPTRSAGVALPAWPPAVSGVAALGRSAAPELLVDAAYAGADAAPAVRSGSRGARDGKPARPHRVAVAKTPHAPLGPPNGGLHAASAAAPGGGSGQDVWCVMIVCLAIFAAHELRRHRIRLGITVPAGLTLVGERPG